MKSITNKAELTLAELISEVLYHPELPEPMQEGFMQAITDVFNHDIDQSEILEYERSAPYINQVIRGYYKKHAPDSTPAKTVASDITGEELELGEHIVAILQSSACPTDVHNALIDVITDHEAAIMIAYDLQRIAAALRAAKDEERAEVAE